LVFGIWDLINAEIYPVRSIVKFSPQSKMILWNLPFERINKKLKMNNTPKIRKFAGIYSLVLLSFVLFASSFASAATVYAVVVGVSVNDANRHNLKYADDDARTYYDYLVKANPSAPLSNFTLLVDRQATRESILAALRQQFSKAKANDRVILFFSGHGAEGVLVPYDISSSGFLYHSAIKTIFKNSKASLKMCILDACFSGSFGKPKTDAPAKTNNTSNTTEVIMFLSSRQNESSGEFGILANGVFTHYLVEGLNGKADLNKDKYITVKELYSFVREEVTEFTKDKQTPVIFGKFPENKVMVKLQ